MSDQSEQQSPFRSRRFILSVLVVGIIALCAVVVLISNLVGGNSQGEPAATSSPTAFATPTSQASSATPTDSDPSACGLGGYETSNTVDSAPEAEWELVGTVAAPTAPSTIGPGVVEANGFRSCFAHTSTGALYAAANVVALGSMAGLGEEVTDKLVLPGPGRTAALEQVGGSNDSTVRYQIAGFDVLSYDGNTAKVDIAVTTGEGKLVSFVQSMQWSGGDWKIVLADNGAPQIAPAPLTSLGGYTPWSGA
jgi:hypothetical protein